MNNNFLPGTKDTLKSVAKGFPEILVEIGVDERIEGRIEISDPEKDFNDNIGAVTGLSA